MSTILARLRDEHRLVVAVILLFCGLSQTAASADSWLAVRLTNGHDWRYTLNDVECILYGEDELCVITVHGSETYALEAIARLDFIPDTTTVSVEGPGARPIPAVPSHLLQNTPNPFSPDTRIAFDLPLAGRAELRIYDVSGRLIRTLVDKKLPPGPHSVRWDGRDETRRKMASGVFFVRSWLPGWTRIGG